MNTRQLEHYRQTCYSFSSVLKCAWLAWEPEGPDVLALTLPNQNVPDMSGTLKTAQAIDPDVKEIRVYSEEDMLVAAYVKVGKRWESRNSWVVDAKLAKMTPMEAIQS